MYIHYVYESLNQRRAQMVFEAYFNEVDSYFQCSILTAGQHPQARAEFCCWMTRLTVQQ